MKKITITFVVLMAVVVVNAQTLKLDGGGNIQLQSRGFLPSVGFIFGEGPSLNLGLYGDLKYKTTDLSVYYNGFAAFNSKTENHIVDMLVSHQVSKITLAAGPEVSLSFVGENHEKVIGMTFMASCVNSNVSSAVMLYSDKYGEYLIGSLEVNPSKKLKFSSLIAYTNAEETKLYGLVGGEYTISNNLFINLNVLIKKSSQIIFGTGLKF